MNSIFKVGAVTNPLKRDYHNVKPDLTEVTINYPARLNAMALDPSRINIADDGIYTPGEIIFSVALFKKVRIALRDDGQLVVSDDCPRRQLIKHAAILMRNALGFSDGLEISVETEDLRHCGLGSSSGLIAAVASAINELYGKPIENKELIKYLAQNHGEEIDGDENHLQHVQCIGGSATSGLSQGGMKILAGESVPIASMDIGEEYTVLVGIPDDFEAPDAQELMKLEVENLQKFITTGEKYRGEIGYRITHETIPAMVRGNLRAASKLIFDYRFDYGSIDNCSFVYPRVVEIARDIRFLFEEGTADTLALSSVGPSFFAITRFPEKCERILTKNHLRVIRTKITNHGYKIIDSASL